MKNQKLISLVVMSFSMGMITNADFTYTGPGMNSAKSKTGTSIQVQETLGNYWRYEITGYDWRLVAGRPVDGAIQSDGKLLNSLGNKSIGSNTIRVSLGGNTVIHGESLSAEYIMDAESNSVVLPQPVVIENSVVRLNLEQSTNMEGTTGSYVSLQGLAIKEPPVPSGDLEVVNLVREGATPRLTWLIKREGSTGTTPNVPDSVKFWTYDLLPGETEGVIESAEDIDQVVAVDAPNSGKNKTNNGHGNNEDGVDVSNPGKSAEKWADNKGIIDQSGEVDDESKGGGAAPSKNN